eukprot:1110109-Rhodomonas_salina.2
MTMTITIHASRKRRVAFPTESQGVPCDRDGGRLAVSRGQRNSTLESQGRPGTLRVLSSVGVAFPSILSPSSWLTDLSRIFANHQTSLHKKQHFSFGPHTSRPTDRARDCLHHVEDHGRGLRLRGGRVTAGRREPRVRDKCY